MRKLYQVMGELLNELKGPEKQCGPADAALCVLSAAGADDELLGPRPRRPQVPADAEALHAQALCRLLAGAEELHHQILERTDRWKGKHSEVEYKWKTLIIC